MLAVFVFSVLFLGKCASAFTTADCPSPVTNDRFNQVLEDRCYRFELETSKEYFDAESFCRHKGGHLAKIESRAVNNFLHNHLRNTYGYSSEVWIGLNDDDTENHFVWVDGTPLGSYNNWGDEEGPRTGLIQHVAEDCVAIDSSGIWRDYRCSDVWIFLSEHKRFICEFLIPHPPTTTPKPKETTTVTTVITPASTTTRTPSPTTQSPSTTTQSPPTTTRAPSTMTQSPSTTTQSPSTTTRTPSTMTQSPSTTTESPPITSQSPSTTTQAPSITIRAPSTTTKSPSTTTQAPSATTQSPPVTTAAPKATSTVLPVASTSTTRAKPETTTTYTCPTLSCIKNCGMGGLAKDARGCVICKCDE